MKAAVGLDQSYLEYGQIKAAFTKVYSFTYIKKGVIVVWLSKVEECKTKIRTAKRNSDTK